MNSQNQNRVWKRLRQNKAALLSMVFIIFTILIAIFAYPLSTDDSIDANRMALEIATQKPGFTSLFYLKKNNKKESNRTFLENFFFGKEADGELIPIKNYTLKNDSVFLNHILDENYTDQEVYPIDSKLSVENFDKNYIVKKTFWLGTDKYGRDVLSRLLVGTRISLSVGFIAVIISIFIGVLLGAIAAYFGGWVDQFITWLINVLWAIPTLLLVFAITFALGKGFWQIFIAVGFTMWVGTARLIRGQVMSLKELEYIQAAKTMGFSSVRIIIQHILPNVLGPTLVMAASNFATAILIEAGLSFLGIGVQPPVSSWGLMIKENYNFIITNRPMLAIVPGIAIMLIVLAFNILGNGLRDAMDVKGKLN